MKSETRFKQRHFVARELQFSIALLAVLALLGGIFLQTVSSILVNYYGVNTSLLGIFLIFGYLSIVLLLAVFFTHRLIGPFKRIEYEMKLISAGDLSKRVMIRTKDDLHVRTFVKYLNEFIANFEQMSKDYNKVNSEFTQKTEEIIQELSKEKLDCDKIVQELRVLQKQIHRLREHW